MLTVRTSAAVACRPYPADELQESVDIQKDLAAPRAYMLMIDRGHDGAEIRGACERLAHRFLGILIDKESGPRSPPLKFRMGAPPID